MASRKSKILLNALISVSCLLIIASIIQKHASPLRISASEFASPVLKSASSAFPSLVKRIIPFASLREENALLKKRVEYLSRNLDEMKLVAEENGRLKNLIDFRKAVPYTTIPAKVIGRDPSNWSNSAIIDKGLSHGIRQNRAILSTRGLVGRTVEVGRYSTKVLLISDPSSKVGVLIQRNRHGGVLVGRPDDGGRCRMIYIALDSDVAPGDRVITAGFGAVFPKDILVGEVVKVGKEPGRLYKYAITKPAEDLTKVEEVLCIK